jgi:methylmalonyl-CoA mutase C-terminal domain/subunit
MTGARGDRRPARVLLAKPGLDGHDRGVKVVGMALRDAGAEVLYLGLQQTPERVVAAARDEDVDVIGLSILSGAHLALTRAILDARAAAELLDVALVVGGTIPPADVSRLLEMGVRAVFPVGSALPDLVRAVLDIADERAAALR